MYLLAQKFQYWMSLIFTKISVLALKYQSLLDHIECTEIQGHHQVWRARRGGPRTSYRTTDANLDCAFVENALIYTDPQMSKVNRIELS